MEKLIELLNEYERDSCSIGHREICGNGLRIKESFKGPEISEMLIISKKFGFIEWLVENDKIDTDKVKLLSVFQETWYYNLYQSLLMILSISDTPIEDLCGYLKDDATEKVDTLLKGIKKSCESLGI